MTGYPRKVGCALGLMLVATMFGCRGTQRQKPDRFMEMANSTVYNLDAIPKIEVSTISEEKWTCPMHPQIREAQRGQCPICGMALVREGSTSPARSSHSHSAPSNHRPSTRSGCSSCG